MVAAGAGRSCLLGPLKFSVTMGVLPARLVFLAFIGLTGCIIYNALYLQDLHGIPVAGSSRPRQVATTSVNAPTGTAKLPPVSTDLPPLNIEPGASDLLLRAVQRELATRGFDVGPIDGKPSDKTRAAISSYQKSQGLPVTGVASDAVSVDCFNVAGADTTTQLQLNLLSSNAGETLQTLSPRVARVGVRVEF